MVEHKRIKISELDESIYRPNDTTVLDPNNSIDPITTIYTILGKHDEFDVDGFPILNDTVYEQATGKRLVKAETFDVAYAKKTFNGNRYHYYIKINQRGELYNPNGLFEGGTQRKTRQTGEPVWQFREINMRVFDLYLSFLKTKNIAWLKNAERAYK